jgi:hypothetical protein
LKNVVMTRFDPTFHITTRIVTALVRIEAAREAVRHLSKVLPRQEAASQQQNGDFCMIVIH